MRNVIASVIEQAPRYESIRDEDGAALAYQQVILVDTLSAGPQSIRGGETCDECGGYVQLSLDPLFVRRPTGDEPVLACLRESLAVILVREDLARALETAKLDVDLTPVFFDGEDVSDPTLPTLDDSSDWSDLN